MSTVGISGTKEEMEEVTKTTTKTNTTSLLQVVNTGIQAALDEFVNEWVMKEKERLLEANTYMSMQRAQQEAGHNLGTLVDNLIEFVLHFADASGSPVTVSFQ